MESGMLKIYILFQASWVVGIHSFLHREVRQACRFVKITHWSHICVSLWEPGTWVLRTRYLSTENQVEYVQTFPGVVIPWKLWQTSRRQITTQLQWKGSGVRSQAAAVLQFSRWGWWKPGLGGCVGWGAHRDCLPTWGISCYQRT